ncbi:MAG: AAA family ATPase [Candidatus Nanoarchaeia archaeon]|jgi:SpoVK/Ycf46/Vps4 family AAA+-type ATPase|nr:AAA family ATPase [Candidatus Nanoarchaeia archaeon]MDY0016391.1 AAA family ATPase [Candidatus Delongbacteria bacterium]
MIEKLKLYIKVRYTLIYIKTNEEFRLIDQIEELGRSLGYNLKTWNVDENPNPIKFLQEAEKDESKTIYLMQDLHVFFKEDGVGISLMRKLRNIKNKFKNQNKIVIVTAPLVKLNDNIKDDFIVIESPLPNYDEIKNEIDDFLKRNNIGGNLTDLLKDRIVLSCLGLTIEQINKIFAKTMITNKKLDEKCLDTIISEKKLIIGSNEILDFYDVKETINNVGGMDNLKSWLKLRSKAFSNEAKEYGIPQPKGLLLLGVQGTGKSLTAKAVSSLWRLPLLKLDIGRVFGSLVGESENRIRQAIHTAEAISPCILWVDEIDKAFAGMQGAQGDSGTSARVFGTLITWMQEKTKPVFMVATANDVSKLPAEILRKGRFDEIFFVDLPSKRERSEIFKIHLGHTNRDVKNFDLNTLVENSEGFTGAEIEQSIYDAMYIAFGDNEREFTTDDIVLALSETVPLSQLMRESIDGLRLWAKDRARMASQSENSLTTSQKKDNGVDFVY